MNRLSVSISAVMLGLGVMIASTSRLNPAIAFSSQQSTAEGEIKALFTQVNTDNSVVATSGWKQFYSDEGNFSIFLPSKTVTNLNSKSEDYSINIYYADTKKSSYIVGYVDYNNDLTDLSLDKIYDNFLKDFLGNDIKLIEQQDVTLAKYRGIEVEYQNSDQEIVAKSRLFLVGKRLYLLDISNYKAGDAKQFFNSFQLEKEIIKDSVKIALNR
ncbi:hypothetical protein NIES267_17280 [Calothrix parasitica NIES-267]|uniref:Uncharacterized protein n=1 Tax=Calothrix parasitica NIES-267 TaxID=1973488 RepID=A0A1Z4LM32_9CYAN|nr:hypothetical protein NIES267_17280 [Calothrix parasitica NIES-267]